MTGWFVMKPPPPDMNTGQFMSYTEQVGWTTYLYVAEGRVVSSTRDRFPVGAPFSEARKQNERDGWTFEPLGALP